MSVVNIRETLMQEMSLLPSAYYSEVLDFVVALKTGRQPTLPETMLLSEAVLSKDWNTEEEDKAWASL